MYKKHIIISYSLGFLAFLAISIAFVFGMQAQAQEQADAIAVRILPNPNNYSIERWYREQGFAGSPQALTVDGYEAIRDGRTVYVNAANVTGGGPYTLYTNIYLISYNQNSEVQTADILGRIVSQWKFNNNLPANWLTGKCNIGTLVCDGDQDCSTGQTCSDDKKCVSENINCAIDSECPAGIYCSSQKAKIIRDVKRIGRLSELEEALAAYRQVKNSYPTLESGTFVRNKTVSVWPSWKDVFLPSLAINKEVKDPINSLGYCEGFEAATCWDKNNNRFYQLTDDNKDLRFPDDSHIIYYSSNENGSSYRLCTGIENDPETIDTGNDKLANFKCSQNILNSTAIGNTAPTVIDYYLEGTADEEFNGFIKVADPDNNPLSFEIEATGNNNWNGWSETKAPVIIKTNNAKQIKLYSPRAGPSGNYTFNLKINDGVTTTVKDLTIEIKAPGIFIEAEDMDHILRPGSVLQYSFVYEGRGDETVQFIETGNPPSGISFNLPIVTSISDSKYRVELFAQANDLVSLVNFQAQPPFTFLNNTNLQYQINIGGVTKIININLLVEPPVLDFDCPAEARIGRPYACFIGNRQDGNGHTITYSMTPSVAELILSNGYQVSAFSLNDSLQDKESLWANIFDRLTNLSRRIFSVGLGLYKEVLAAGGTQTSVSSTADPNKYYLYGQATEEPGEKNITVNAINEYGTPSSKSFSLKINSYCGNGTKDIPNTEGKGGYYNDGYEDCDGIEGTAQEGTQEGGTRRVLTPLQWVANSAVDKQYACTSNPSYEYPIKTGNYCIFASPLNGGGFKGDGLCQTQTLDGRALENCQNAPEDCGACASGSQVGICNNDDVKGPGELCDGSDLGGKTCGDFNPAAIYPYNNLSLTCSNDCQSFNISGCFYPHQNTTTPTFSCQSGWFDCDGNIINGCESSCCPDCSGKQCGPDGCGNANGCGTCSSPATCTASGQCCTPNCAGKQCGLDGCGGTCGTCNPSSVCKDGQCLEKNCGPFHCWPNQYCCDLGQGEFCNNIMLPGVCTIK